MAGQTNKSKKQPTGSYFLFEEDGAYTMSGCFFFSNFRIIPGNKDQEVVPLLSSNRLS